MQDDADETIARIAAALRDRSTRQVARRGRVIRALGGGAALIAAGLLATVWVRSAGTEHRSATRVANAGRSPASAAAARSLNAPVDAPLAGRAVDGVALQPLQLALRAPDAHRVSIVGDFNGWDATRSTMTR